MTNWKPTKLIWRSVIFIILLWLTSLLLDLMHWSGSVFLSPEDRQPEFVDLLSTRTATPTSYPTPDGGEWARYLNDDTPLKERIVSVTYYRYSTDIECRIVVPSNQPLAERIARGVYRFEVQGFAEYFCGTFELDREIVNFDSDEYPHWQVDSNGNVAIDVEISITGVPSGTRWIFLTDRDDVKYDSDRVEIYAPGGNIILTTLIPGEKSNSKATLVRTFPEMIDHLAITVAFPNENSQAMLVGGQTVTPTPTPTSTPLPSRRTVLLRTGAKISDPLRPIIFSFVKVLPILLFLIGLKRIPSDQVPEYISKIKVVLAGLLTFHFGMYIIDSLNTAYLDSSSVKWLAAVLNKLVERNWTGFDRIALNQGPTSLIIIAGGVLLPGLILQYVNPERWDQNTRLGKIAGFFATISLLLIPALSVWYLVNNSSQGFSVPLLALTLTASLAYFIYFLLYRIYNLSIFSPLSRRTGLLAIWVMILVVAIEHSFPTDKEFWYWVVVTILVCLLMIVAFAEVVLWGWSETGRLQLSKRGWWVFIAVSACLAFPIEFAIEPGKALTTPQIGDMAFHLDSLIIFIWLGCMVVLLRRQGQDSLEITSATRIWGVLAASSLLVNYLIRWMYIPLTFLLCLAGLYLLVRTPEFWKKHLAPNHARIKKDRVHLIEKLIDLRSVENAFFELRKALATKFGDGSIEFASYSQKLTEARKDLDEAQAKVEIGKTPVRDLVLAYGPFSTAWENAWHGLKYSLIFAIPWFIVYLLGFVASATNRSDFFLWDYFQSILFIVGRWGAVGFVMGYYYPYLRGNNGIQKALFMAALLIFASLPLEFVFNDQTGDWGAFIFYALEVFIQCMLLGLIAFDYVTLRENKRGFQSLFEFYGLPLFGVSVSSVALSIGGLITSLLTGQTTELLTALIKLAVPNVNLP